MAVDLPETPGPAGIEPALVDFGAEQRPAFGGATSRLDRLGSRFAAEITYPPLPWATTGRVFVARLLRAKSDRARLKFPQPGFTPPLAAGGDLIGSTAAAAANTSSVVANVGAGYAGQTVAVEGQFVSLLIGGRHYLHQVTADVVADGGGNFTLPLNPRLRVAVPAAAGVLHLNFPRIEGFIEGDEATWQVDGNRHVAPEFRISETE